MKVSRRLPALFTALNVLTLPATLALTIPMSGWTPVKGDAGQWTDQAGACLIREERHTQAFPAFRSADEAKAFALRLQKTLTQPSAGVSNVITQPVDRAGIWGVLAAYTYEVGGVSYHITQLYLSDGGKLRTVTGSNAQFEGSACVGAMHDFLRNLAD